MTRLSGAEGEPTLGLPFFALKLLLFSPFLNLFMHV